ncbi:Kelch-like protein diablo [Gryllus bimaculatus]|nr:Kelch-like protein diablo [Gryllus bimaculatus]
MARLKAWGLQDRPLNTVHFESPSHTGTLLGGLNALRCRGLLLDITLAHRAVLASVSDYFRAMFTDAMREARQSEVRLRGVSAAGMRLLLDYAYTARLALNLANIQDALAAAAHTQVPAVVEACASYLQAQLDLENCVDMATIAETYSLAGLRGRVYRFMSAHLRELADSPDFQRLAPPQLEHLLACDFPVDCPEDEVLRISLKWLHGDTGRLTYAPRLLRRIHFPEISPRALEAALQNALLGHSYPELQLYRQVLAEACRQARPRCPAITTGASPLVNSRGMELAVVKVGGFSIAGITNEITYLLPSTGRWRHLTTIPHVEQCNFGTATLGNELYVVGGCFNQSLQENIHPFGFRYSPRANKWSTMAPMQRERCRFSLNVLRGYLYAVGGASETELDSPDETDVSACERYDPATDSWECIRSLPGLRSQHAGASQGGKLVVSGGLDRGLVLSSVLAYNPDSDTWTPQASMLTPRADHALLALGNKLYACGGWYETGETGNRILADTIDAYDPATDSWEVITHVPTPRYHAGIVGVGSCIYFIGGFHSDAMFDRATAVIEYYDLDTGQWTTGDRYPQEIWEHACVTLYIPRCRDDMEVMDTPTSAQTR